MITLPKKISRWDSLWLQVHREGDLAIYRQTSKEGAVHYNTVWVRLRSEQVWPNGKVTPAKEALPSGGEWGLYGWTYRTCKDAFKKFKEVQPNPPKGCV